MSDTTSGGSRSALDWRAEATALLEAGGVLRAAPLLAAKHAVHDRPAWVARVLKSVAGQIDLDAEAERLIDISGDWAAWPKAKDVFHDVRARTLQEEHGGSSARLLQLSLLENAAKTIAISGGFRFDPDSPEWFVRTAWDLAVSTPGYDKGRLTTALIS